MEMFRDLIGLEEIGGLLKYEAVVYLALTLLLFWIGKKVYDLLTPFKIDHELTTNDNKALAVSFSGYLSAIGIIIWGVIDSPSTNFVTDIIEVVIWSIVGILLLNFARIINDKFLLSKFDNTKEIITDKNVGTGAVEFGAYVGTAFIIKSVVEGESSGNIGFEIGTTLIFFFCGQLAFILFAKIYQAITTYDLHEEIEKDNIAAGTSFGLSLVAIGLLLSDAITRSDSLVYFAIWFVVGSVLLIIARFITDKVIFPHHKIDDEIKKDRNWGVSIIEGVIAITVVLLLNSSF